MPLYSCYTAVRERSLHGVELPQYWVLNTLYTFDIGSREGHCFMEHHSYSQVLVRSSFQIHHFVTLKYESNCHLFSFDSKSWFTLSLRRCHPLLQTCLPCSNDAFPNINMGFLFTMVTLGPAYNEQFDAQKCARSRQWRIQDFSDRGGNFQTGGANLLFGHFFLKTA